MDKLVEQLGVGGISKSQVSQMAKTLDEQVEAFRTRALDGGPYTFVWLDALTQKVREGGRTVNVHALVATGVNANGQREILGWRSPHARTAPAGWRSCVAWSPAACRGCSWSSLMPISGWSRRSGPPCRARRGNGCRTYYLRNLLTTVPKSAQPWVATLVRTIFDQPTAEQVRAQHRWVIDALEANYPAAADHLDHAREDLLAFAQFPREIWKQVWSNNPQERLNKEIRRRTNVVGIFPDRAAIIRLVGAVLAEKTDEWTEARRYMGLDILAKARLRVIPGDTPNQEQPPGTLTA